MPGEVEVESKLDLGPPTQDMLAWAQKHIKEDPDRRCQDLEDFRDMIYSRGECVPHRTDDAFLLRFLRSRKFNLESAHRLLVNYCDFREENSSQIEGVDFGDLLTRAGELDFISVPPYKEQTGKRILLYKIGNWDPEKFSVDEIFGASWLVLELAILEASAQIFGGICIVDCENISMQQALYVTPHLAHRLIQLCVVKSNYEDCTRRINTGERVFCQCKITSHPHRLEAMHIVNNSWIFETFFTVFKPLLHEKMKSRLFFHGSDMESLHKHVDPKCLPKIYGGVHPNYSYSDWIEGFRKDREILEELQSLGYKTS